MQLRGRNVINVEVDGVDTMDYPDFSDAYFSYAEYEDTGEELDEADLELLTVDNYDVVNEMAYEHYI